MQLLLSKGARLRYPDVEQGRYSQDRQNRRTDDDKEWEELWSVIQDSMAQVLVPSLANEAVVGLALAAGSCKRKKPDS